MDGSVLACAWLSHGAVGGLILLCLGSLSVWLCGQPVRRARIVVLTLLGGFAVPWLGLVSIVPRWSAGIVLPVPRSSRPLSGNTGAVTATGTPAIAIPQTERSATQVASLSEPTAIVKTALIESVGKKPKAALVPSLFIATSWETVLLSAYAALSLGWIAWWLIGQVLIWRITRAARLVSPTIHEVFLEISGPAGHRVTVLESATDDLPFTFTWLRPVIVLPTALCADGDSQELRFCLCTSGRTSSAGTLWPGTSRRWSVACFSISRCSGGCVGNCGSVRTTWPTTALRRWPQPKTTPLTSSAWRGRDRPS